MTQGRNNRPTPLPHRLHPTAIPHSSSPGQQATTLLEFHQQTTQYPPTPLKHPRKTIRRGTNHLLRPNEQQSPPTGKQMRRLATGGAFHKTVFSPKYRSAVQVPSQHAASAIAARCISTCSTLHPAHRPSAILTAPAIPRLHSKPAAPSHQVSIPLQTPPSAPPITFQAHPSPAAQQSPPLFSFRAKPSLITTHQRQTPNPELSLYIPTTPLLYTQDNNPSSLSCTTARHSPPKNRP